MLQPRLITRNFWNKPVKVRSKIFCSSFKFWETLCGEAAEFASRIPAENLINISHSCDRTKGTVIVWYRTEV